MLKRTAGLLAEVEGEAYGEFVGSYTITPLDAPFDACEPPFDDEIHTLLAIDELGVQDRVTFVGSTSEPERYFRAADVFLFASPTETQGLVLTEAMAAGGDEARRAFDAMMGMKKIDVAAIEAARRG